VAGHLRRWSVRLGVAAALTALASCSTCAPTQRVPIDSAPRDARVFVDGSDLGHPPLEVDLRSDRDHSVFVRRKGYRPALVILRSERPDPKARPELEPGEVKVQLVPIDRGRDLEVELDSPDGPDGDRDRDGDRDGDEDGTPLDPEWRGPR
jgi:predicted acylesterase/phospholipase RssA